MQRSGRVDFHKEYGRRDDSGEYDLNDDNAVSSFLLVDEKENIMVILQNQGCVYGRMLARQHCNKRPD